jgi:hypothetical protein
MIQKDDNPEEPQFAERLRLSEHASQRAKVLAPSGTPKPTCRSMCFVDYNRVRCDPEGEPSIGKRTCELDIVVEDGISLIENVVLGKERPPQEKTTRRRLGYGSRSREVVVKHQVLPQESVAPG